VELGCLAPLSWELEEVESVQVPTRGVPSTLKTSKPGAGSLRGRTLPTETEREGRALG
jgi:hypothetical protein